MSKIANNMSELREFLFNSIPFQTAFGKHRVVDLYCPEESLTLQSSKDECDINSILERWQRTGVNEHESKYQGQYGNFIDVQDYQSSLNQINSANDMFYSLPSSLRDIFKNSPVEFLAFAENPDNRDKMISMGLMHDESVDSGSSIPEESSQNTDS